MANIERLANQATVNMRTTLVRLRTLAGGFFVVAAVIALATYLTGFWVFDKSRGTWLVLGAVICLIPLVAAVLALAFVVRTAKAAPRLVGEMRQLIGESRQAAAVLIDHDSGKPLASSAKSFSELRSILKDRRKELPALFAGVRALTSVPGLLAIALLGVIGVGALGTILLIVGVAR